MPRKHSLLILPAIRTRFCESRRRGMPFSRWSLMNDRPVIQITLTDTKGQKTIRTLLADTGAGDAQDQFELVLQILDCVQYGGRPTHSVAISGAYGGNHPVFSIAVEIPALGLPWACPTRRRILTASPVSASSTASPTATSATKTRSDSKSDQIMPCSTRPGAASASTRRVISGSSTSGGA